MPQLTTLHAARSRRARVTTAGSLGVVLLGATLSGCGATVTAPDVVGMRLDAAHRKFEKVEVTEFDDKDVLKDRTIFLDHGWVVLGPEARRGTKNVDTDTTIKLSVAKVDDKGIRDRLPPTHRSS